jgi:hypothetical protein
MVHIGPAVLDTRMLLLVAGWIGVRVLLDHVADNPIQAASTAFDWASVGAVIGGKAWAVFLNPTLLAVPEVLLLGDVMTVTGAVLGAVLALGAWAWRTRRDVTEVVGMYAGAVPPFLGATTLFAAWAFLATGVTGGGWRWWTGSGLLGAGALLILYRRHEPDSRLAAARAGLAFGLGWLTVATAPGMVSAWQVAAALLMAAVGGSILFRRLSRTP